MTKHPKKVLICDDEEGIRESLKLILGDTYDLVLAGNSPQCLEILENSKDIGLVLLDIKMPVIDGLDTLEQIKKKYPKISVVMVTGYRSVEIAAKSSHHGATGYIIKPFKAKEILETVKRHLG